MIPALSPDSDMTGHADGMVRFVDEDTVIGNMVPGVRGLEQRIRTVLNENGLYVVDFPYDTDAAKRDRMIKGSAARNSAAGCYLDFLETEEFILLPAFGNEMDDLAIKAAQRLYSKIVVPVRIDEIAAKGGCLNCISWELNEEGMKQD